MSLNAVEIIPTVALQGSGLGFVEIEPSQALMGVDDVELVGALGEYDDVQLVGLGEDETPFFKKPLFLGALGLGVVGVGAFFFFRGR